MDYSVYLYKIIVNYYCITFQGNLQLRMKMRDFFVNQKINFYIFRDF